METHRKLQMAHRDHGRRRRKLFRRRKLKGTHRDSAVAVGSSNMSKIITKTSSPEKGPSVGRIENTQEEMAVKAAQRKKGVVHRYSQNTQRKAENTEIVSLGVKNTRRKRWVVRRKIWFAYI